MSHKPPEDYYWIWAVNGFKGLIGLIANPLNQGHKAPDEFWNLFDQMLLELSKIRAMRK